jgi:hypothetical protein
VRHRIKALFRDMWDNDDADKHALGKSILKGEHTWLESGTIGIPYEAEQLAPPAVGAMKGQGQRRVEQREEEQSTAAE